MKIAQIKNNFRYYILYIFFLLLCIISTTITFNKIILNNDSVYSKIENVLENNFLFFNVIMIFIQILIGIAIIVIDSIIIHTLIFYVLKEKLTLKSYRFPVLYANITSLLTNIIIFFLLPNYEIATLKLINLIPISLTVKSIILYCLLKNLLLPNNFSYKKLSLVIVMYFLIIYIFSTITIFYF